MRYKQFLSGLSAVMMAAAMLGTAMPAFALDPPRYGDYNQDGAVDAADSQVVLQIYAENLVGNTQELTEWEITLADVNFDGKVDLLDAQFILLYYAENTLAGNDKSWEEILNPVTDYDIALETLTTMMEGVVQRDVDVLLEYTDMFEVLRLISLIFTDEEYTEEDFRAEMETDKESIISYTILGGREDRVLMAEYNKKAEETRADTEEQLAEETDEATRTQLTLLMQMMQPLEGLCVFDVETVDDGEAETVRLYVACKEGKWYVDTMFIEQFADSLEDAKRSGGNDASLIAQRAFNSALTDLEEEGYDIGLLNGEYYFTGADFEHPEKPAYSTSLTEQDMVQAVCSQVLLYMPELTELAEFAVHLEHGMCLYAAAGVEVGGKIWYGCCPNAVDADAQANIRSIRAALEYAKSGE